MRSTTSRLGALFMSGALLLAACGGSDDEPVPAAGDATNDDAEVLELPEPAPGPVPDIPVAAESVTSPLPEVAVRQINGDGGWVQFKNLLPADNPLLLWFWAPH